MNGEVKRKLAGAVSLAIPVALLLGACGSSPAAPDLAGRTFVTSEATGYDLVAGSEVAVSFEAGQVSVNAGCNTLMGSATWTGGVLNVPGPVASTMMACDTELMEQDEWLSEFLTSQPALTLDGSTLTLGDDSVGMTFTEQE